MSVTRANFLAILTGFGLVVLPAPAAEPAATQFENGKQLYQSLCASCHGVNMDGRGPLARAVVPAPPNLKEHVKKHDGMMDIMHPIMHGDGPMPAWRDIISHEEAFSIARYLVSSSKK